MCKHLLLLLVKKDNREACISNETPEVHIEYPCATMRASRELKESTSRKPSASAQRTRKSRLENETLESVRDGSQPLITDFFQPTNNWLSQGCSKPTSGGKRQKTHWKPGHAIDDDPDVVITYIGPNRGSSFRNTDLKNVEPHVQEVSFLRSTGISASGKQHEDKLHPASPSLVPTSRKLDVSMHDKQSSVHLDFSERSEVARDIFCVNEADANSDRRLLLSSQPFSDIKSNISTNQQTRPADPCSRKRALPQDSEYVQDHGSSLQAKDKKTKLNQEDHDMKVAAYPSVSVSNRFNMRPSYELVGERGSTDRLSYHMEAPVYERETVFEGVGTSKKHSKNSAVIPALISSEDEIQAVVDKNKSPDKPQRKLRDEWLLPYTGNKWKIHVLTELFVQHQRKKAEGWDHPAVDGDVISPETEAIRAESEPAQVDITNYDLAELFVKDQREKAEGWDHPVVDGDVISPETEAIIAEAHYWANVDDLLNFPAISDELALPVSRDGKSKLLDRKLSALVQNV